MECVIYGCDQPSISAKWHWCSRHYGRWAKYGDPYVDAYGRRAAPADKVHRAERYGLTKSDFEAMWTAQEGRCGICGKELHRTGMKSCNIDHDHSNGIVRGLLCRACNSGIGLLGDDPERLRAALEWLKRSDSPAGERS